MTLPALSPWTPLLAGCPSAVPSPPVCWLNRAGFSRACAGRGHREGPGKAGAPASVHLPAPHHLAQGLQHPCQIKEPSGDGGMLRISIQVMVIQGIQSSKLLRLYQDPDISQYVSYSPFFN